MTYQLETSTDHQKVIELLEEQLYAHNAKKLSSDDGRLFSIVAKGKDNAIIAGIAGWTWTGACEITQLWVEESVRKEGLGKRLLKAAEEEAKKQGCHAILIRTYSFQAPEFYEHHGYRTEHVIDNFPAGKQYHILIKQLS